MITGHQYKTIMLCAYKSGGMNVPMYVVADRQKKVEMVVVNEDFFGLSTVVQTDIKNALREDLKDRNFDADRMKYKSEHLIHLHMIDKEIVF